MSTLKIHEGLLKLINDEMERAVDKYGDLASGHEAYAVMLEEYQEAQEETNYLGDVLYRFWSRVKGNKEDFDEMLPHILDASLKAAAELIQVAAVAQRYEQQLKENEDEDNGRV